ncbi:MAG: tetratricopeptide repeat protein [Acetobacteraceae bacterium]|nr:tetratricopeptide repeat protein [Acetobacteraceae bacterium]
MRRGRLPLLVATALLTVAAGETTPSSTEARMSGAFGAYLAGHFAARTHDFPVAARELEQALRDDPTVPELRSQAFLAALLSGQPEASRLAAAVPDNPLGQLVLADRDAKSGSWASARSRFAALRPDQPITQVLQPLLVAWSDLGLKHPDAALAALAPLADGTSFRGVYALHAAMIADLAGRAEAAARFYRIAEADYGQVNLRLAVIVASWQARQGDLPQAQRTIGDLANADGEFALSRQGLQADVARRAIAGPTDGIAEAYLAMAASLRQQSTESAEALLRLALELRPNLTAARIILSDMESAAKRPEDALASLAEVAADDPLAPLVELRRAALLDDTGRTEASISLLEKLSREHPDRPEPLAQLGDVLRRKERFTEAAAAYGEAIGKLGTPSRANWPLFYARGIALERAGNWAKAEADLKYALELAPDQPSVLNYLAYAWTERGEHLDEAHGMLERAMAVRPNEGAFIDSFGWLLLRQGDVEGAIRQLDRAVELETEDPTINGHLGDALAAAGRMREAEFQWRRALNLKPDPEEAKHLQEKLASLPVTPAPVAAPVPTSN